METCRYVICLLTDDCYGSFIEGKDDPINGCPVCVDYTVALSFKDTEQAHKVAHECGFNDGEYAIHGYFFN